jgi:hypothetical protein
MTVKNLLSFLPIQSFTPAAYAAGTTYGKFEDTQAKSDIVTSGGIIYESILAINLNHTPASSATYWRPTNLDSLRIRSFLKASKDNMISALRLTRKLVENQYIYNVGEDTVVLPGNFSGWVFEPKGSDYIKIRINQMALQANTSSDVSLFVINQGTLLTTLTLHPVNGVLTFESVPYEITSKGRVILAFASQSVKSQEGYNDALKYDGFVAYPVTGTGSTAVASTWTIGNCGNGLNFNVSAYMDSNTYIDNNEIDLAKMLQSQFEMDFLRLMIANGNVRANRNERGQDDDRLYFEVTDLQNNTVARRYTSLLKETRGIIQRTFDRAFNDDDFMVEVGTI